MKVFTLWARERDFEGAWMLTAIDEWSWEGNPSRCEDAFRGEVAKAEKNGWLVREFWLEIDQDIIEQCFRPFDVEVAVELRDGTTEAGNPPTPESASDSSSRVQPGGGTEQ